MVRIWQRLGLPFRLHGSYVCSGDGICHRIRLLESWEEDAGRDVDRGGCDSEDHVFGIAELSEEGSSEGVRVKGGNVACEGKGGADDSLGDRAWGRGRGRDGRR